MTPLGETKKKTECVAGDAPDTVEQRCGGDRGRNKDCVFGGVGLHGGGMGTARDGPDADEPDSDLYWVDNCGHAAMMEHPEQFNNILMTWLKERAL